MARLDVGGGGASTKKPAPIVIPPPARYSPAKKDYEVLASNKGTTKPMTGVVKAPAPKAPAPAPKAPAAAPKAPAKTTSSGGGGGGGSTGGGGGGGSAAGQVINLAPAYDPMKDPVYLASLAKLNDLWNQASGYKGQIDTMMKDGFTYDPESDASYKSLQALATKQAGVASKEAMEDMNERGILNSTITSDRMGQIQQTAQDAVTAQVPGLKQQAYGMYMDKLSLLNNLWNSTVAQAQQERGFTEDKRRWELGYEMDKNQFNTSVNQWNQTFDYQKAQDSIANSFKTSQLELDRLNFDLNYYSQIQKSVGGGTSEAATNQALGELIKFKDKAGVMSQLRTNIGAYLSGGVDLDKLLTGLNKYYPGIEQEAKGGGNIFAS